MICYMDNFEPKKTELKRAIARAQEAMDQDCAYLRGQEDLATKILTKGPQTKEEGILFIQLAHIGSRLLSIRYAERVLDDVDMLEELFWNNMQDPE